MSECFELWDWQKQKALYNFSYSLTFIEALFSTPVFYLALTPRWTTWGSVVAQRYFEAVRDQTTFKLVDDLFYLPRNNYPIVFII